MEQRLGVIGLVVEAREKICDCLNAVLSDYGHMIVGRMGIPYRERGVSVIALIVDGNTDELGALSGKLGSLPGVTAKIALTKTGK
ncbi:MAG: iron-only hydrogenase system regulator [Dethiobacter sp.]|jgi:putative iron-only hydrogenase system regulator|nr:iron-only hydrogenase system regulator [Dethiobacter sp.]